MSSLGRKTRGAAGASLFALELLPGPITILRDCVEYQPGQVVAQLHCYALPCSIVEQWHYQKRRQSP
eukprot:12234659-Prorocentrum_lima.AAC.1